MAERFGRYWLHEKIGQGGMAEIFRATIGPDPETYAFDLVIKRLMPALEKDQGQVDMFLTEADIAKFLHHPNLIRVYEAGLFQGRAFIAMEMVRGHDLGELMQRLAKRGARFPSDVAVYIALQVLRALDYVHRARSPGGVAMELIHRDVTPANIYVTLFGEVKLGDFGVARVAFLESHDEAKLLKGKAAYMPPEVLEGEPVDQRVDLWGVATTLYEMLTGARVYEGVTDRDLMTGLAAPPIVPVHKLSPDVEPRLARIVNRALHRKAAKRPGDALTFYRELKVYLRDSGIHVDAQGVSRFVGELTGALAPGSAPGRPRESDFRLPEYRVPLGPSPTQRFERIERRRAWRLPVLVVGGLLALAAAGWLVYRFVLSAEAPPPPVPEVVVAPAAAVVTPPVGEASDAGGEIDLGELDGAEMEIADSEDLSTIKDPNVRFRALMHRGNVQLKRGRPDTALSAFQAAVALKPDVVLTRLGVASALLALGRHAEAETQVNAVLEKKPRSGQAYLLLGDILRARGDTDQARWAFERCQKIAPESKFARAAKKALAELE